jgi:3-methyl-2-oxobutanoate hydroxymethyltransferase
VIALFIRLISHSYDSSYDVTMTVVECVPPAVAKAVTEAVKVPVIGIGSGPHTTGQVLVYHDLLGVMHHPHHEKHVPSFCKRYAKLGEQIHHALVQYRSEVLDGTFPDVEYSPYKMSHEELAKFEKLMAQDAAKREKEAADIAQKLREADEYEITKLY